MSYYVPENVYLKNSKNVIQINLSYIKEFEAFFNSPFVSSRIEEINDYKLIEMIRYFHENGNEAAKSFILYIVFLLDLHIIDMTMLYSIHYNINNYILSDEIREKITLDISYVIEHLMVK